MRPNQTASLPVATVDETRSNFPALDRLHNGLPVAYFDGPGGTQTPREVVDAMTDYLYRHNANTHWNYPTSSETDAMIARSRSAMADFLARPSEIIFGANSTTLAFRASRALGHTFEPGDEIVVTELDHHANIDPWRALHRERGCVIRPVKMNLAAGELDWSDFESKITSKTKLVAVGAASNALGTINDIPRAVQLAHSVGALAFVDAVHYAPHHLVDVDEWSCDFLVCSAYKFYGPHIGAMYCRRELLESLPFAKLSPAPDSAPERAETGTLNHEAWPAAQRLLNSWRHYRPRNAAQFFGAGLGSAPRTMSFAVPSNVDGIGRNRWRDSLRSDARSCPHANGGVHRPRRLVEKRRRPIGGARRVCLQRQLLRDDVVERLGLAPTDWCAGCACYTTADEVTRLIEGVRAIAAQR